MTCTSTCGSRRGWLLDKALQPLADYLIANIDDRGLLDCDVVEVGRCHLGRFPRAGRGGASASSRPSSRRASEAAPRASRCSSSCANSTRTGRRSAGLRDRARSLAGPGQPRLLQDRPRAGPPTEEVEASAEFIRTSLDPYPGRQFRAFWDSKPRNPEAIQQPDVVIRREADEYVVEVMDRVDAALRVSEAYRHLHRRLLRQNRGLGRHAVAERH